MLEYVLALLRFIAIDFREEILAAIVIFCLFLTLVKIRKKKTTSALIEKPAPAPELESQDIDGVKESDQTKDSGVAGFIEEEEKIIIPKDVKPLAPVEIKSPKPEPAISVPEPKISFLDRLKTGLSKTRQHFSKRIEDVLSGNKRFDENTLEQIEEILITSDVGVPTTMELIARMSKKAHEILNFEDFKAQLKTEMLSFVDFPPQQPITAKPHVILMVGVNGVGKTTTIGKLAAQYTALGKKVLLSASDTFRAAAAEQLQIWADRAGADIVRHRDNADPAAVAYDSMEAAVARGIDVVIVDTAGRLQTKVNLMEQLKKIKRSIAKKISDAPHEVLLVLDATTGQNALSQAKLFHEGIGITGIIVAKLDGTAKGGIILGVCHTLNIPIRYIGIGEGIEDLQEFDAKLFIDALL